MTRSAWLVAVVAVAAGCSGDEPVRSGVDPAIPVAELQSSDVQAFCDWMIALEGGFGHSHHCADGATLTTQSVAICVDTLADLTCTDPIGDFEDCLLAVDGDLCLIPATPACAGLDACFPMP